MKLHPGPGSLPLTQEMTQTHRDRTKERGHHDLPTSPRGCWRKERTLESEGFLRILTLIKGSKRTGEIFPQPTIPSSPVHLGRDVGGCACTAKRFSQREQSETQTKIENFTITYGPTHFIRVFHDHDLLQSTATCILNF